MEYAKFVDNRFRTYRITNIKVIIIESENIWIFEQTVFQHSNDPSAVVSLVWIMDLHVN